MKIRIYEQDYLAATSLKLALEEDGHHVSHSDNLNSKNLDEFELIITEKSYVSSLMESLKSNGLCTPMFILSSSWTDSLSQEDIEYKKIVGYAYKPYLDEEIVSDLKKYFKI
jgi:hypothetical protein